MESKKFICFLKISNLYHQVVAHILMLNTGLHMGKLLGLLNSNVDLENKTKALGGWGEIKIGKPKTSASNCTVPLNGAAMAMMIEENCARSVILAQIRPLYAMRAEVSLHLSSYASDSIEFLRRRGLNTKDYTACATPLLPI